MNRLAQVLVALLFANGIHCAAFADEFGSEYQILTRRGDEIFNGDQPFRFISFNVPNLHLIEDSFSFPDATAWRWPNEFEIEDALESIRQMGGTVVRTYVLSVRRSDSDMGSNVHVLGPGEINEEAFRVLDKILQIAGEKRIRVIIPLVDNWHWWGGIAEYAKFRGKQPAAFWKDEEVMRDFEQTIRLLLTRVNSYSGIPYKEDPAIFGWETGNELDSPPMWTRRIAAFIKSFDPNHLVIDGNSLHGVQQESLDDPNIDVLTTHHYPNTGGDYVEEILEARQSTTGKKPYFVGEFGFTSAKEIDDVFETVRNNDITGALLWSLRFHNRDGGFYWHSEPAGGDLFKAYHWPGFPIGQEYEEALVLMSVYRHAHLIRGIQAPSITPPNAPYLLPIAHPGRISWRGSAGATGYDVERATNESGPWRIVGSDISDAAVQYRPLFSDRTIKQNKPYYYRVIARNPGGNSEPSNVVGPILVPHLLLVDELEDTLLMHHSEGTLQLRSKQARRTQEDAHRLELGPGGSIVYRLPGAVCAARVFLFRSSTQSVCEITFSPDGNRYEVASLRQSTIDLNAGDYGYLQPVLCEATPTTERAGYVRLRNASSNSSQPTKLNQEAFQISRVEIAYE